MFEHVIRAVQNNDLYSVSSLQDQEGNTVIQFATSLGHTDIVKCVIDSVPSADLWKLLSIQNQQDETTLHISVNSNNMETLPCLVESVETTELHTLLLTQDIYGDTAIHSVAYGGHVDMLKYLLDKLSLQQCLEILNIKNNKQFTPLKAAKSKKQYEAAKCIAEYKKKSEHYFEGELQFAYILENNEFINF